MNIDDISCNVISVNLINLSQNEQNMLCFIVLFSKFNQNYFLKSFNLKKENNLLIHYNDTCHVFLRSCSIVVITLSQNTLLNCSF